MKKKFIYEYEDESPKTVSFEYDLKQEYKLAVKNEDVPVIYANKAALITLAKTFIKMATCQYVNGFHYELKNNFSDEGEHVVRVVLED